MKTISVPDMMCEHCVARITEALKAKDLKFTVDLAGKTVSIDGCEHCAATAIHELEDLGFTPSLRKKPREPASRLPRFLRKWEDPQEGTPSLGFPP